MSQHDELTSEEFSPLAEKFRLSKNPESLKQR
jgi:hypothetical protein